MRALHSLPTFRPLVATIATLLIAGCSAEAGTASSGSTASPNVAEAVTTVGTSSTTAAAGHPHGGHPGPDFLVFAALHESINLTAEQEKTIQALVTSNAGGSHPFDKARAATLAASIRAGHVVVTNTAPTEDEMAAHRTASATALTTLHSTLTATQRRALVDALAKKDAEHANDRGERDAKDGHGGRGPMDHLLEGLNLTAAQQQEITSKLEANRPAPPSDAERAAHKAEHETMHAAMQAKLETFAGETFDANAFVTPPAGAGSMKGMRPGDHGDHFAADLAIVTAALDATQREKLAERIEAGPPAHTPSP